MNVPEIYPAARVGPRAAVPPIAVEGKPLRSAIAYCCMAENV